MSYDSQGLTDTPPTAKQVGNHGLQSPASCGVRDHRCHCGNGPVCGPGTVVAEEGTVIPGEDEDAESKGTVCFLLRDTAGPRLQTPKDQWTSALNTWMTECTTGMLTFDI